MMTYPEKIVLIKILRGLWNYIFNRKSISIGEVNHIRNDIDYLEKLMRK